MKLTICWIFKTVICKIWSMPLVELKEMQILWSI